MTFSEKLSEYKDWVISVRDSVTSEEATKTSLVMPFFQRVLGYDVFSPTEFIPEYKAGFGDKPADRVDYTITIKDKPEIIIECKHSGVILNNQHEAQLQGYFASLRARTAILTNGIVYKFYTDIERANLLDKTPFMTFDILNQEPALIVELERFCKDKFNADEIFENARRLKYVSAIKGFLSDQLTNPSDDFVRAAISHIDGIDISGKAASETVEEFRSIVKSCFVEFIGELPKIETDTSKTTDTDLGRKNVEDEVLSAVRACVKDVVEPVRLSLYRVTNWTSVYYRNCALCKVFTIGKDYCEIVFLEKFADPNTNAKNRKHTIAYSVSDAEEIQNYRDDFIASIKDIDAIYDKIHHKK